MINIIGGGPVGLTAAFELAKAGEKVTVHEEHKKIGAPVQCTGIVTRKLSKLVKLDDCIMNRIRTAKIISKRNDIDLPVDDIVIDRQGFDRCLLSRLNQKVLSSKVAKECSRCQKGLSLEQTDRIALSENR